MGTVSQAEETASAGDSSLGARVVSKVPDADVVDEGSHLTPVDAGGVGGGQSLKRL